MSLIDDVKTICDRLAPLGWRDLLLAVTNNSLDISQPTTTKLKSALKTPVGSIDRSKKGFEDFNQIGIQGITPGSPSNSLLFHALASPQVHPTATGMPSPVPTNYPTLDELDAIENFIYSLVADRSDLSDAIVAVFAYQYREGSRTTHLRHADFAFSRTGVARVGTTRPHYDPARRSFWVIPAGGGDELPVLPARYAAFLARRAKPGAAGSIQGIHKGADDDDFVFPLHKLFNGKECLAGMNLQIIFAEFHRNEKLRKTHRLEDSVGGLPVPPGFDVSKFSYIRDSSNGGNLASLEAIGASTLVVPTPGAALVRTVAQINSITGKDQLVHFIVPKVRTIRKRPTRFADSTLEIPAFGEDRLSPEYVNIRHQIDPNGPVNQIPTDLNALEASEFASAMANGDYAAAHFTDDAADGCVEATVTGLTPAAENLPAFSLITAPDFFPLADQFEVETDRTIARVEPLSKGRLPVNPSLPRPSNPTSFAFDRAYKTVTAIVGADAMGPEVKVTGHPNRMVSFLSDASSNVFAPGWDTSRSRDAQGPFLTTYGLGSPFPEDAKLCAALASFWPAVAPDNGRTFGNQGFDNQLPMLDEELGFHPNHERVKSGEILSHPGWDGEFGPFYEKVGNKFYVNYAAIARVDYVSNAMANRIRVSLTSEVQSEELIARHQALNACKRVLRLSPKPNLCLVVVRKIDDWSTFGPAVPALRGAGFLFEFAELTGSPRSAKETSRVRHEVKKKHVCQLGVNGIAYKNGGAASEFITPLVS
jgi:hypothetical protein